MGLIQKFIFSLLLCSLLFGSAAVAALTFLFTSFFDNMMTVTYLWGSVAGLVMLYLLTILYLVQFPNQIGNRLLSGFAILLCGLTSLLWFAGIYKFLGTISVVGAKASYHHDIWTSLYLSMVTWSTIGYGDVIPTVAARPFAAIQGIFGYIYLALIAGLIIRLRPTSTAGSSAFSAFDADQYGPDFRKRNKQNLMGSHGFSATAYKKTSAGFKIPKSK